MAFALSLLLLGLLAPPDAHANTLRILTSMPPALTEPYVEEIERIVPGLEVLVLNKNTVSAVEELLRGNQRAFDVFWASAPEAFELLSRQGAFATDSGCAALRPDGFAPFAISSVGWAFLRGGDTVVPRTWDELLSPVYRGQIGMAPPSRSGTSHMMVERFLQVRGWAGGWGYFLDLTENMSTITSRSFGVTDGIRNGRFGVGLTIDFLAGTSTPELDFRYGEPAILFPAQIGVLAGSGNPDRACDFVDFVTSEAGQRLLLDPAIGRIPISDKVRDEAGDRIPAAIRAAVRSQWLRYNARLASDRYWAVNVIFDLAITDKLDRRRVLWSRLHALEGRVPPGELAGLRRKMRQMPVGEQEVRTAGDSGFANRVMDLTDLPDPQRALIRDWEKRIEAQIAGVEAAAARLEKVAR
ncbi:MAG TPA: substrate-binding domain-containing protein [Albidovulum sp.]|uniref:ABC transporter substrate-binding protein n=1 Tax=Albidovulum sp. TaxID=1872424 RepID=UPI002C1EFEA7|nr:substrate-binding domain-containing protein [Albidovulum sp.]